MTTISNYILKSRNSYNSDYICKYVSKEVAKSSARNREIWMQKINLIGKSLGEQWLDGFMSVVGDVETWLNDLISRFNAFQAEQLQQLANTANAAADVYYANKAMSSTIITREVIERTVAPVFNFYIDGKQTNSLLTPSEEHELTEKILQRLSEM